MISNSLKSISLSALVFALGFGGGWLFRSEAEVLPSNEPAASTRFIDSRSSASRGKKTSLSDAEIHELGSRLQDTGNPASASARGKLLAGMNLENAELIGQYLQDDAYYFRLGELRESGVLDLLGKTDQRLINEAIAGWLHADFEGAMAWYDSLDRKTGELSQKDFAVAIGKGLASFDLKAAEDFALSWDADDPFKPGKLMEVVFAARAKTMDLPELGRWADGVSNRGALDWNMLTAVAHRVVLNDPLLAIEWAATLPKERDWVNDRIAGQWNDIDPKACSEWVITRPASDGRNRSISSSFYQWVSHDLEGGKAFLATMKPSPEKDFALAGFSSGLSGRDIPGAINMARQINDPALRETKTIELAQHFWRSSPQKAEAWLPESGLTAEQIEKFSTGGK